MGGKHRQVRLAFSTVAERTGALFDFLFVETPTPCWLVEPRTLRILDANPAATKLYETTVEEFRQKQYPELHPASERAEIAQTLATVFKGTRVLQKRLRHVTKRGHEIKVSVSALPALLNRKRVLCVFAIGEAGTEAVPSFGAGFTRIMKPYLDELGEGVIITDAEGKVEALNKAAEEFTGWSESSAKTKHVSEILHLTQPESKAPINLERTLMAKSESTLSDVGLLDKAGNVRVVKATHTMAYDAQATEVKHIFTISDRTSEYHALQTVSRAQRLFESVVLNLREPVLVLDHIGRVVIANHQFYRTFNTDSDRVLGMPLEDAAEGMWNIAEIRALIETVIATGATVHDYEFDHQFPQPVGRRILRLNIIPLSALETERRYALIAIEDLTQRWLADQVQKEAQERYRYIAEVVGDYAYTFDVHPDNRLEYVWLSESFARVCGNLTSVAQLRGKYPLPVYEQDQLIAEQHIENILNGRKDSAQFRIVGIDGQIRWVEDYAVPILDETGTRVVRIYGAARDITRQKQYQAELEQLVDALRAVRNVNQLITRVKDPTALIQKACELLAETRAIAAAAIILTDDRGVIKSVASAGFPPQLAVDQVVSPGEELLPLSRRIWETNKPLFLKPGDPERKLCPIVQALENNHVFVSPLSYESKKFGVFAVFFTERPKIPEDELELVCELVGDIAFALYSIELEERESAARRALEESEERFRMFFNHAAVGLYRTTPDGRILMVNPALVRMLGYFSADELCRHRVDEFFTSQRPRREFLERIERDGVVTAYETIWLKRDGTPIHILESAIAVKDASGRTLYYEGSAHDITPLKKAQAEIERLAAFPELMPEPVLEVRADHEITYANPAARALVAQLALHDIRELLPPGFEQAVEQCLTTGESNLSLRTERAGKILAWAFHPIPSLGVVHCYATDITEHMRLRQAFEQAQKLEAVGQLAAGVAHDFNNILTVIQMGTSVMLAEESLPPSIREIVAEVVQATERGANLTRQLLTFSRRQHRQPRYLDLNEVVAGLMNMLRRVIPENIRLSFQATAKLPPVFADLGMMEQVIINLVTNARDVMPNGGVISIALDQVTVSVEQARQTPGARAGKFVRLSVSDTGTGIPEEIRARIFEPFFTTKEPGKGSGMGLAVVHGIVQQHEGWITFETEVGKGTTFYVYLPAAETAEPEPLGTPRTAFGVAGGSETIMIVEDDSSVRTIASAVLRRLGYRVIEAASGPEAINAWKAHGPKIDLLLTDLVLPGGMSGRELADQLRRNQPGLKVVYMSGYSEDIISRHIEFIPGENLLQKPFPPSMLGEIIRRVLDAER